MTNNLKPAAILTFPQFPISFQVDGVLYAGSVNPLKTSPQCQQALRTARATAIKILKTNLDGPSPRVAISFRAGRPVSGRQLKSSLLNWYRIFRVSVSVTVQSEVTRSRLRVVRRRTHVDGQGNVPSSGRVVSGRKGPFRLFDCLQKNLVFSRKMWYFSRKIRIYYGTFRRAQQSHSGCIP